MIEDITYAIKKEWFYSIIILITTAIILFTPHPDNKGWIIATIPLYTSYGVVIGMKIYESLYDRQKNR